jgi:hypothetical protein
MTLDVTAYKQLSKVSGITRDDDSGEYLDADGNEIADGWDRYADIEFGDVVSEVSEGLDGDGFYAFTARDDSLSMNYPAVITWNKHLIRMCETHRLSPKVFLKHVGHSDFTGPVLAAKLAAEFTKWRAVAEVYAENMVEDGEWWLRKYDQWIAVYTFASDGGAVHYH